MDVDRFATLTRSMTGALSTRPARRGVTRALAGLTLAGTLGGLRDLLTVEANKKHHNKKRRRKKRKQRLCRADASFCVNAVACNRSGERCFCGRTAEGATLCAAEQDICVGFTQCDSSAQCTAPRVCVDVSGCCAQALPPGSRACLLPCANPR